MQHNTQYGVKQRGAHQLLERCSCTACLQAVTLHTVWSTCQRRPEAAGQQDGPPVCCHLCPDMLALRPGTSSLQCLQAAPPGCPYGSSPTETTVRAPEATNTPGKCINSSTAALQATSHVGIFAPRCRLPRMLPTQLSLSNSSDHGPHIDKCIINRAAHAACPVKRCLHSGPITADPCKPWPQP